MSRATSGRSRSAARALEDDVDDALSYARDVRDLMTGARALLAVQDTPGAIEEIVSVARARAELVVAALEQLAAAAARQRSGAQ